MGGEDRSTKSEARGAKRRELERMSRVLIHVIAWAHIFHLLLRLLPPLLHHLLPVQPDHGDGQISIQDLNLVVEHFVLVGEVHRGAGEWSGVTSVAFGVSVRSRLWLEFCLRFDWDLWSRLRFRQQCHPRSSAVLVASTSPSIPLPLLSYLFSVLVTVSTSPLPAALSGILIDVAVVK